MKSIITFPPWNRGGLSSFMAGMVSLITVLKGSLLFLSGTEELRAESMENLPG